MKVLVQGLLIAVLGPLVVAVLLLQAIIIGLIAAVEAIRMEFGIHD